MGDSGRPVLVPSFIGSSLHSLRDFYVREPRRSVEIFGSLVSLFLTTEAIAVRPNVQVSGRSFYTVWAYGRTILCSWSSLTCTRNQRITFAIAARLFNDLWMDGAHLLHFSGLALPRGGSYRTRHPLPSAKPSTQYRREGRHLRKS